MLTVKNVRELQKKEYWNEYYQNINLNPSWPVMAVAIIKDILDKTVFGNIYEYILWNKILKQFLPRKEGLRILEIGSAPGNNLVRFYKQFGYEPYGIEYTVSGAEANRRLFKGNNLPAENIFEEDFFLDGFHERFKGFYDIVFSFGFVEHFADVSGVIERHLNLLKKGGILVVTIPNLQGKVNNILCQFFNNEILSKHNLEVMELKKFNSLFNTGKLKGLYCNYYGVFSFSFFGAKKIFRQFLYSICLIIQVFLNFFLRLAVKMIDLEFKHTSPFLIFIGEKI